MAETSSTTAGAQTLLRGLAFLMLFITAAMT